MQSMTHTPEDSSSSIVPRLLTAAILIAVLTSILLFAPAWVMICVLGFVFFLAMSEFLELNPDDNVSPFRRAEILTIIFMTLAIPVSEMTKITLVLFCAWSVVSITFENAQKKSLKEKIALLSHTSLGVLYLIPAFFVVAKLVQTADYQFWFFVCFTATALGDTFAYFAGRSLGKHKLAPIISPNKTWEGAVGALFGGAVGSVVLHQIYQRPEAIWQQILLGVVLAIIGIYGDLAESAIKRAFGVKDSGNILPGHGGVLDRIDAYLFTLPAIYFYSQWIAK